MSARYRVGRQLGRTLYRDDQLVGLLDTAEQAAECAAALNQREADAAYAGRLVELERQLRDRDRILAHLVGDDTLVLMRRKLAALPADPELRLTPSKHDPDVLYLTYAPPAAPDA